MVPTIPGFLQLECQKKAISPVIIARMLLRANVLVSYRLGLTDIYLAYRLHCVHLDAGGQLETLKG